MRQPTLHVVEGWPVLHLAYPPDVPEGAAYADWISSAHGLLGGVDAADRQRIFGDNAAAFYGID